VKIKRDEGNDISRTDFVEGYGISCFDQNPEKPVLCEVLANGN